MPQRNAAQTSGGMLLVAIRDAVQVFVFRVLVIPLLRYDQSSFESAETRSPLQQLADVVWQSDLRAFPRLT
jgi:hypothetical protein